MGSPLTKYIGCEKVCSLKELDNTHDTMRLLSSTNQKKLVGLFKPKSPVIVERFSFHKCDKLPGEPIKDFVIIVEMLSPHM